MTRTTTTVAALAVLAVALPARALPDTITYAAHVENDAGAFNGTVSAVFQLFDADTGGSQLFTETAASVIVVGGELVYELGSAAVLDSAVLERDDLFLAVTLNGEALEPRVALRAVPYALEAKRALEAATLEGLAPADLVTKAEIDAHLVSFADLADVPADLADGDNDTLFTAASGGGLALSGTSFSIANAAINNARLADNSVTAAKISDGSVGNADLANGAVTSTKLASRVQLYQMDAGCRFMEGRTESVLTTTSTCDRDNETCGAGKCRDCSSGVCGTSNCAIDICPNDPVGFLAGQ